MGIAAQGLDRALQRQTKSLRIETKRAQAEILDIEEMRGANVRHDVVQRLVLRTDTLTHVYLQPYAGPQPLPGEHHVLLPGTLPASIALVSAMFGPKWRSPNSALAKHLNKACPDLKLLAKATKFEWGLTSGKIQLDWTIQVFARGGQSHLVMKPGRYGGVTAYHVGFQHLQQVIAQINRQLDVAATAVSGPLYPVEYADIALSALENSQVTMLPTMPMQARR